MTPMEDQDEEGVQCTIDLKASIGKLVRACGDDK